MYLYQMQTVRTSFVLRWGELTEQERQSYVSRTEWWWRLRWILYLIMTISILLYSDERKMMNNTRIITICGLMTALAMIFSYIESLVPIPIPVPGVKLGLANMAIMIVMFTIGTREAVFVDIIRVVLTSMLFGNFNSFIFSISGAVLSIVVMAVLKHTGKFSEVGISVTGGVMHNIGQIIAAIIIMDTSAIILYLPVLMISGVVTGIVIGIVASIIVKRVNRGVK